MVQCNCSLDADLYSCIMALHIALQHNFQHHHHNHRHQSSSSFFGNTSKVSEFGGLIEMKTHEICKFYLAKFKKLPHRSTA